jgi:hypothetical protein
MFPAISILKNGGPMPSDGYSSFGSCIKRKKRQKEKEKKKKKK